MNLKYIYNKSRVLIELQRCNKESIVLYDYESYDFKKFSSTYKSDGYLMIKNNSLFLRTDGLLIPNVIETYLSTLTYKNG